MLVRNKLEHKTCSIGCYYPIGLVRLRSDPLAEVTRSYYVTCRHQRFAFRFRMLRV